MKNSITPLTKNKQNIIKEFMKEIDLPDWFRGLSQFQREGADSLLNCIRDDCEQATSHRVRDALRRIGIEPLVGPSKIKLVMQLSRGSDIAFLWFLMELYYRNSSDQNAKKYTVNEQIFLTVVAYLDTIPTLRELDKLLPKKIERIKTKQILKKKNLNRVIMFPYFEKQPRPSLYGKKLVMNEIDNMANFSEYQKSRRSNFMVPNEANRWFANYSFKKTERIAKGIINDQIDTIFEHEFDGDFENQENLTICAHHEIEKKLKETRANELQVAKRNECQKYFDVNGHFKNKSYKRVMNHLDTEINEVSDQKKNLIDENLKTGRGSSTVTNKDGVPHQHHDETLYDFGHDGILNGKTHYFKAATANKPFKFNYNKIFDLGAKDPIKDAIASALNAESSDKMSSQHTRAVRRCCKEIWTQEVKKQNSKFKQEERKMSQQTKSNELEFGQCDLDPQNSKLMQSMLFKALQEIKKNKKFVLASLPDAHKIPILKEWIKYRYGFVYTREDKKRAYKRTKKVFQVLRSNALRVRIPHLNDLSKKRVVSYGCKDYLLRKTNFLKEIYQHNFKENLLEDARIYWAAIRPYQCSKGPPRNEFFAYLPGRKNDVHMFRPWKGREYVHAKDEWDRRQRNKRSEFSY